MGTYVRYSLLRLSMFVLAFLAVYALGARSVLAVALAALISMALSFVLLRPMRDDVVHRLESRRHTPDQRGEDEVVEDELADDELTDDAQLAADKPRS